MFLNWCYLFNKRKLLSNGSEIAEYDIIRTYHWIIISIKIKFL